MNKPFFLFTFESNQPRHVSFIQIRPSIAVGDI